MRYFTLQAFLEVVRIPSYFYVSMYVWFNALEFDDHPVCGHDKYPLDHVIVYLDMVIFTIWVCCSPMFMII